MAGIYIHIPFCHKACHYCDFHFSTQKMLVEEMVSAICREAELCNNYFNEKINTIYFGGGTPSILSPAQLEKILSSIYNNFRVDTDSEITLEANPDDISEETLNNWLQLGINRLSIGIQTFNNERLQFLNRNHNTQQSIEALEKIANSKFDNFNVDIIYGIHNSTVDEMMIDIKKALSFSPTHISAYCLTIEEKTVFGNWLNKNKIKDIDEENARNQFYELRSYLLKNGFEHYEISNFSLPGKRSKHNSNYWNNVSYTGLGPSAVSLKENYRKINISNNALYIKKIKENTNYYENEILDDTNMMNEYIMTALRKKEGIDLVQFHMKFGAENLDKMLNQLSNIKPDYILKSENSICLSEQGIWFADGIAAKLFL